MDIESIIKFIISNPSSYPGRHLTPQARTDPSLKPLEPLSQMQMIWKASIEYINENLHQGKGVNIPGFGGFTFDISTDHPRISAINPSEGDINRQRQERKHVHTNRPIFIPDPSFEYLLQRYHRKSQVDKPSSQRSIYQKGFQMIFCNPVPIAFSCNLDKVVIRDSHKAIFSAIKDLTKLGRNLHLAFGFAALEVQNMSLKVVFAKEFSQKVNNSEYEKIMRRSDNTCESFWRTTSADKWRGSVLSQLWGKTDCQQVQKMNEKTLALKILSLDLASTVKSRN